MADLLDLMRRNQAGNWTIADVALVCRQHGVRCTPPAGGSHHKVSHSSQRQILTIPSARPIKPVHVRMLVKFIAACGDDDAPA